MSEFYIVTDCDDNAYNSMLVPFISSLKTLGEWNDKIAVVDLGLSEERKEKLIKIGIEIIPRANRLKTIMCDRFSSITEYFDGKDVYIISYDADVWFTSNINSIKNLLNRDTFISSHDATWQGFLTNCLSKDSNVEYFTSIYERIKDKYDYVLQVGFVAAHINNFKSFSKLQEFIIDSGLAKDVYGTDTLNLNLYYFLNDSNYYVCGVEYNCLPEWGIYTENEKFYIFEGKEVKAIHVTSPHRSHGRFSYRRFFEEDFLKYHKILN